MEAILLVGGLGTRLRPLTDDVPKPLLPVAGAPVVQHQILRAQAAGVQHVVLATSFRAELFAAVLGDGSELGLRVDYAVEDEPLGTGGAIRNAADLLGSEPDDPVLVLNGDILDSHELAAQVTRHTTAGADVTLYLTRIEDARAYGCVPTDPEGRVTGFLEKMPEPVSDQINAGCYVFRRKVIDAIPSGQVVSVERRTFPELLSSGAVLLGHLDDAYWRDLGTPQAYVRGSADAVRGLVDAPARPGPAGESLVPADADVSDSAFLCGGTCLGAGCMVGTDAVVEGSILLDGAAVAPGAVVRDSVVGRGARIGAGAVVERVVVGAGIDVPAGARPEPGTRLG